MEIIKKFHDIENLRKEDIDLGGGITRKRNDLAFRPGDIISITEKVDGANASMCYDSEENLLCSFSRKKPLDAVNTLDGFFNYIQGLAPERYEDCPNYVVFGEWLLKNKIVYEKERMHKWYIYDIYDRIAEKWLLPEAVKAFAKEHDLEYVHELYYGPFVSWEHCMEFCNSPMYGDRQEGIVVRNVTQMENDDCRYPVILKIVNQSFAETKKQKVKDPEAEAEKAAAYELMGCVVTEARVEKEIFKMRDDGILPSEISPKDMTTVARNLPKRVWEDVLKEEPEIVERAGKHAGKACNSIAMQIARSILVG